MSFADIGGNFKWIPALLPQTRIWDNEAKKTGTFSIGSEKFCIFLLFAINGIFFFDKLND